jgi:signal transduction histidine kinase
MRKGTISVSIKKKTFIAVLLVTIGLLTAFCVVSSVILVRSYAALEREDVVQNVNRVSDALSARLTSLDNLASDWANWDDTYRFAQDHNSEYVDRNMGDETFTGTDLSFIMILDTEGQTIFERAYDREEETFTPVPEEMHSYGSDDSRSMTGIASLSGGRAMVVSKPILTSVAEGPSAGTVLIGRFLDSGVVESLSQTTHLSVLALDRNDPAIPGSVQTSIDPSSAGSIVVKDLSNTVVSGYTMVDDVNGDPAFILQVNMPRDVWAQGQKTLYYVGASLLSFGILFGFLLLFLMDKLVLRRVSALNMEVAAIGSDRIESRRVSVQGSDELSSLSTSINRMLDSIENSGAQVRSQKALIDRILSNTPNGVLVIDDNKNLILANSAARAMLGMSPGNLAGVAVVGIPGMADLNPEIERFTNSGVGYLQIGLQHTQDGGRKTLVVSFTRIKDEGMTVISVTDVTEERERQDRLYLADRLASVGQMASGIAHQLSNPLTSVIGMSQLLREEELPEQAGEDVVAIHHEAQRAGQIVKNLLSFARKHEMEMHPSMVGDVIKDVLKLRAHEHQIRRIEVTTNIASDIPLLMMDYFQMQQVFLNIIVNAEEAMTEAHGKGYLSITAERLEGLVRVSFADDGPGIAPENVRRIFDPFFTTKGVGKGTGLGLSVCYGVVTAHGGQVYAESECGKGATFIVDLPVPAN